MGAKVNKSVCFEVFPERGLLLDLVRFLMAHLLRTHRRERVIRPGKLYCLIIQSFVQPFISDTVPEVKVFQSCGSAILYGV